MDDLDVVHHVTRKKIIALAVVSPMTAIHFIKDRNFRIVHVSKFLNSKEELEELDIYEKDKSPWITKDHRSEIATFLDLCIDEQILECHIEIEGGINFSFSTGELYVRYEKIEQIADAIKIILNYHGYYAKDRIWDYVSRYSSHYDIKTLQFLNTEQITDEMLDIMLAKGVKYLEEGRIYNDELDELKKKKEQNNPN